MLYYALICLSLALTGVAGLQMMYMFYLETVDRERQKHITDLERECKRLRRDLIDAEKTIADQKLVIGAVDNTVAEEGWAEVIGER
ncbi:MAG: hypothetical protein ACREO5_10095 [Candidatus Binatia bacterium]